MIRRRWRGWQLMGGTIASVAVLALTGCASNARAGAGAVPTLQIDYPDFQLTPGPTFSMPDNAVPLYVATSPLPTASQSAEVWTWPTGPASARVVKTLARELGLTGDPQQVADGWEVGSPAAMVRVYDDPGWPWSYTTDKTPAWWTFATCNRSGMFGPYFTCNETPTLTPTPPSPAGSPSPRPTISGPGVDQASAIARPLLAALGVTDPVSVSNIGDDGTTTLNVTPSVQGMLTKGIEIQIQVDSTGVVAAAGRLASPKPGAVYPLISAMEAFDLSNGWMGPTCFAEELPVPSTSAPPFAKTGCQPSVPENVSGAVLGLELEWQNEQPILLPAWFLTVEGRDDPVLATVAIDRAYLAGPPSYSSPPSPTPNIPPSPVPSP